MKRTLNIFILCFSILLIGCQKEELTQSEPILKGSWELNFTQATGTQAQSLTFDDNYLTKGYKVGESKTVRYYTRQIGGDNFIYFQKDNDPFLLLGKYEFWHPDYLYITRSGILTIYEKT